MGVLRRQEAVMHQERPDYPHNCCQDAFLPPSAPSAAAGATEEEEGMTGKWQQEEIQWKEYRGKKWIDNDGVSA